MHDRPLLLVPLLPVVVFTWWVARQYLHVSRELKRLESLKKSPVFVLFSETLQVTSRFSQTTQHTLFNCN